MEVLWKRRTYRWRALAACPSYESRKRNYSPSSSFSSTEGTSSILLLRPLYSFLYSLIRPEALFERDNLALVTPSSSFSFSSFFFLLLPLTRRGRNETTENKVKKSAFIRVPHEMRYFFSVTITVDTIFLKGKRFYFLNVITSPRFFSLLWKTIRSVDVVDRIGQYDPSCESFDDIVLRNKNKFQKEERSLALKVYTRRRLLTCADVAMRIIKDAHLLLSFFSSSRYPRHLFCPSENKTVQLYLVQLIAAKEIQ